METVLMPPPDGGSGASALPPPREISSLIPGLTLAADENKYAGWPRDPFTVRVVDLCRKMLEELSLAIHFFVAAVAIDSATTISLTSVLAVLEDFEDDHQVQAAKRYGLPALKPVDSSVTVLRLPDHLKEYVGTPSSRDASVMLKCLSELCRKLPEEKLHTYFRDREQAVKKCWACSLLDSRVKHRNYLGSIHFQESGRVPTDVANVILNQLVNASQQLKDCCVFLAHPAEELVSSLLSASNSHWNNLQNLQKVKPQLSASAWSSAALKPDYTMEALREWHTRNRHDANVLNLHRYISCAMRFDIPLKGGETTTSTPPLAGDDATCVRMASAAATEERLHEVAAVTVVRHALELVTGETTGHVTTKKFTVVAPDALKNVDVLNHAFDLFMLCFRTYLRCMTVLGEPAGSAQKELVQSVLSYEPSESMMFDSCFVDMVGAVTFGVSNSAREVKLMLDRHDRILDSTKSTFETFAPGCPFPVERGKLTVQALHAHMFGRDTKETHVSMPLKSPWLNDPFFALNQLNYFLRRITRRVRIDCYLAGVHVDNVKKAIKSLFEARHFLWHRVSLQDKGYLKKSYLLLALSDLNLVRQMLRRMAHVNDLDDYVSSHFDPSPTIAARVLQEVRAVDSMWAAFESNFLPKQDVQIRLVNGEDVNSMSDDCLSSPYALFTENINWWRKQIKESTICNARRWMDIMDSFAAASSLASVCGSGYEAALSALSSLALFPECPLVSESASSPESITGER